MKPDELRALADALERLKFRCDGIDDACSVEDAADYLRACADAKPVAWLYRDWANVLKVSQLDPHEDGAFAVFAEPQPQADAQPVPAVPAGWKLVPVEPTEEWLEVGRKAIEDVLIEWRDDRLAESGRANGCVIRERDGTPSNVIRFGPETALRIGYKAMLAAAPAVPQEK